VFRPEQRYSECRKVAGFGRSEADRDDRRTPSEHYVSHPFQPSKELDLNGVGGSINQLSLPINGAVSLSGN